MNKFMKTSAIGLAFATSLSACATISVPEKPDASPTEILNTSAPTQFFNASGASLPMATQWWTGFNDPILTQLVERALNENRQLDVAEANIAVARAGLARQTLETSYSTQTTLGVEIGRSTGPNRDVTGTASGGLGASWEYDAFGRIAAAIKASELNVEAAEQARRDVAVIVSSETALAYVDLRGAQRRFTVAQDNAEAQAKSLDLLQTLLNNGRATALDVSRAEAQYRTTLADLPRFQATIESAISRLAVLIGSSATEPNSELLSLKQNARPIPSLTNGLAMGSPEDLLRRRPDIRLAETEIARLLALSDVERARLFPTVVFNADILALFGAGNRLDQLSSFGFGVGPALRWEGPDLRRVRADINIADAQTEQAYRVYEQTVLQALADVEAALSNTKNEARRQQDLSRAVNAARDAEELAQLRFEEGVDDFLDVLDAQRTLLAAEDRLAENRLQTTRLTILTYKELGGIE
ncbi:efflux transporter outer membrane subunit [Litorimonas sp. RW-G-Af-16]|uniref:efflux transporter outer membrane subunit n=1 Tax=Litorimonas sp. RW-G-Af-16 TaxID=3241168 RepID=UPI00390C7F8D